MGGEFVEFCRTVSHIMEADVWQFGLDQQLLQLMVGAAGVHGGFRVKRIVEDPGRERLVLS